jgi:hypothetical protein
MRADIQQVPACSCELRSNYVSSVHGSYVSPFGNTLSDFVSLSISHDTVNLVMSLFYSHPDGIKYYFA